MSLLATEEEAVTETSRLWAEFRLAAVGQLVVGDLDRGQLGAELKSLSAKKWKHPITGMRVTFGYSTIERWYYVVLNNPKARLRALSKQRRDAGLPRSLTKQMRHYLARQAKRHSSWSYHRHHQALVRYMKEREWARTPGYSTVRRYLRSIFSSQNVSAFLIDARFLLRNTTETFWGASLIVLDGKDNTFCFGFLRDLLRLRNSLCISAGVIVFGSDASSLATEKDVRSVVDLCRELGILVIEEPKLPVLAIVATHADRFSDIVTDDRRILCFCTDRRAVNQLAV